MVRCTFFWRSIYWRKNGCLSKELASLKGHESKLVDSVIMIDDMGYFLKIILEECKIRRAKGTLI